MDIILNPVINVTQIALNIYMWMVLASVILSWLVVFNVINTQNRFIYMLGDFLHKVTEPALSRIRKIMPDLGGIDLSPMVLILAIILVQGILSGLVTPTPHYVR